jgi:excisionase family DNA binding protein
MSASGRRVDNMLAAARELRKNEHAGAGRPYGKIQPPRRAWFLDNGSTDTSALLTIVEAADLLRISVASVRRLQGGRSIPFLKVGGSVRFARSDIASFLDGCRVDRIARHKPIWQHE